MSDAVLHSISVASVTLNEEGQVLLIKRRDNGQWQAPGGVLELGETFEDGVIRETFEETGVRVGVEILTGVYKNLARGVVALVYRCHPLSGDPSPSEEASEVLWIDPTVVGSIMSPAFAVRVSDALAPVSDRPASRTHNGRTLL